MAVWRKLLPENLRKVNIAEKISGLHIFVQIENG